MASQRCGGLLAGGGAFSWVGERGQWVQLTRTFRDGSEQVWWAIEIVAGPYGPGKAERAVVATTDPTTLPDLTTWYLVTNLPAPADDVEVSSCPPADLAEIVRLYGLRTWVEQNYKHALGWSQYQVRSDTAMRRHWQFVCCAFSFCWYYVSQLGANAAEASPQPSASAALSESDSPVPGAGTGKKISAGPIRRPQVSWSRAL